MWYCSLYNQVASDVWRYNNPVYKLMTNKLQLMLIDVLIRSILEHYKVLVYRRVSVVIGSLMISSRHNHSWVEGEKKIGKSVNICNLKLWALKYRVVFETRCIKMYSTILWIKPQPLYHPVEKITCDRSVAALSWRDLVLSSQMLHCVWMCVMFSALLCPAPIERRH